MRAILAWVALASLGACFGTSPQPVYYALEAPATGELRAERPVTVVVRRFETRAPYDRSEIVYRSHDRELRFYPYHLWASVPGRMMAEAVAAHLQRAHVVPLRTRDVAADYELHGEITALEERDVSKTDWRAHLAVRFQLIAARSGKVVWEHAFDSERPVAEKKPRAVVEALDAILASELDGLSGALDAYLAGAGAP